MATWAKRVNRTQFSIPTGSGRLRTGRHTVRRGSAQLVVLFVLLAAVVVGGGYAATKYFRPEKNVNNDNILPYKVERRDLRITVTEDGNLESAENIDIKCQVAGGSSILWIVKDGSVVEKGDKLVELDQAQLEEQINTQRITFEKARSAVTQAEKDYAVAEIGVKEYTEGTFKKEVQDAGAQITIAMENLRSAQNSLEYTQRMFRKGYVSSLDLESAQFAVQRAQLELDSANTAKEVLEKFTYAKTLEDLNSKLETARAKFESEKAAFALEEGKLKRLQMQIDNCVINAPQSGMVVYANDPSRGRGGGQQGPQIEEGATVRERQTILRLPDLSKMQAKVAVHESKVRDIRPGMPALVTVQGKTLKGNVDSVANQPEAGQWFNNTVKEYATIVKIEGEQEELRPGMTAEVEILIATVENQLVLPIAAVVEDRGRHLCWVTQTGKLEERRLKLGQTDEKYVEVLDGVAEGETVVLNPRTVVDMARQPESPVPGDELGEKVEFGAAKDMGGKGGSAGGGALGSGTAAGAGSPQAGGGGGPQAGGDQAGVAGGEASDSAGGEPGAGGGRRGGGRRNFDWMSNDADGDGKVSRAEAPERLGQFFDFVDENKDEFIDKAEADAAMERARNMQRGGGGGFGGGEGGGGGFGGGGQQN